MSEMKEITVPQYDANGNLIVNSNNEIDLNLVGNNATNTQGTKVILKNNPSIGSFEGINTLDIIHDDEHDLNNNKIEFTEGTRESIKNNFKTINTDNSASLEVSSNEEILSENTYCNCLYFDDSSFSSIMSSKFSLTFYNIKSPSPISIVGSVQLAIKNFLVSNGYTGVGNTYKKCGFSGYVNVLGTFNKMEGVYFDTSSDLVVVYYSYYSGSSQSTKRYSSIACSSEYTTYRNKLQGPTEIKLHKVSKTGKYDDLVNAPVYSVNGHTLTDGGNTFYSSDWSKRSWSVRIDTVNSYMVELPTTMAHNGVYSVNLRFRMGESAYSVNCGTYHLHQIGEGDTFFWGNVTSNAQNSTSPISSTVSYKIYDSFRIGLSISGAHVYANIEKVAFGSSTTLVYDLNTNSMTFKGLVNDVKSKNTSVTEAYLDIIAL